MAIQSVERLVWDSEAEAWIIQQKEGHAHHSNNHALFHFMVDACKGIYRGAYGGKPPADSPKSNPLYPLRGVAYFSWDSDSGGPMQIRRTWPHDVDFFASSQVVIGWGIHQYLRDTVMSDFAPPATHLISRVDISPSFLPYYLEAQRLSYTAILLVPVVFTRDGKAPNFLGCFALYLRDEAAIPQDQAERSAFDSGLLRYAQVVSEMVHEHEEEWRRDTAPGKSARLAGCWYDHAEASAKDLPYLKEVILECDPALIEAKPLLIRWISKRIRAQLSGEQFLIKVGAAREPQDATPGSRKKNWEKLLVAIPPDIPDAPARWNLLAELLQRLIDVTGYAGVVRFTIDRPTRPEKSS